MSLSQLMFSFEGRIGRKAFWFAIAIFFVAQVVAGLLDWMVAGSRGGVISAIVSLVLLIASIAVSVKRWHDRDKSGWWYLIAFIPVVGGIWMLVENGFLRGTPGPNRFGPDPLAADGYVHALR